jgi:anti-sigma factor RsiW
VTDCHELRLLLGAYVLGALDADEAGAVREHVAECPGCAAEYARLAPLPGLLTLAAGAEAAVAEPPPPALEERLLDAVALEAPPRHRRRRLEWRRPRRSWLAAGAVTAALAAAVAGVVLTRGDGGPPPGYGVTLQASAAVPRASAWAQLQQVTGGTSMKLWVKDLPRDAGAVYEVHCDAPGWTASAGTFRVGPDGSAHVVLTTAARRGQYDAIRIERRSDHRVVLTASLS